MSVHKSLMRPPLSLTRLPCRAASRQTLLLVCPAPRSFLHNLNKPLHLSRHHHVISQPHPRLSTPHPGHRHAPLFNPKLALFTQVQHYSSSTRDTPPPPNARKSRLRTVARTTAVVLLLGGIYYLIIETWPQQTLNPDTFTPFTVTGREQVSPTAFILTVRPSASIPGSGISALVWSVLPLVSPAEKSEQLLREIWQRGTTWSVEVKQPMLQVARDYTPLPEAAEVGVGGKEGRDSELRFLVRRMERGEVSSYLSGLRVGEKVELRGPHYGFDVGRRLGGAERVVFLAGGTGIAPALQVVKAVLEMGEEGGPRVDILWANRQRADCRACPGVGAVTGRLEGGEGGPVLDQLAEMQRRYPGRVSVRCTVDEERSFVEMGVLAGLIRGGGRGKDGGKEVKDCWLHDQDAVSWRPAADVDTEKTMDAESGECRCGSGKNLLFVSGPDGFVEHFAGPKRWANGMELQGSVGGILGKLRARNPDVKKDWLVLKL